MVRIEKYHPYKKNGYIYTYGREISCCPDCEKKCMSMEPVVEKSEPLKILTELH